MCRNVGHPQLKYDVLYAKVTVDKLYKVWVVVKDATCSPTMGKYLVLFRAFLVSYVKESLKST